MSTEHKKTNKKQGADPLESKTRIDYVLVVADYRGEPLITYLQTVRKLGLSVESFEGIVERKLFLVVHIPQKAIDHFCEIYDFRQEKRILKAGNVHTVVEEDAFTNANRILLTNRILESARFGPNPNEYGLSQLIRMKVIEDAYPLHDGSLNEGEYFKINDRQRLSESWASFSKWYKEIPLDLINRYFGNEVAFYFAWLEFFSYMLIPAALFGSFVFIASVLFLWTNVITVKEVCEGQNTFLCPTCELRSKCHYRTLSFYCTHAQWNFIFDNYFTISFSVFMSVWSMVLVKLWKRQQNRLRIRWGLHFQESNINESFGFADRARRTRENKVFGTLEAYVPSYINVFHILFAISGCILIILVTVASLFAVVFYKLTIPMLFDVEYENFFSLATSSLIQGLIIRLLKKPFNALAIWLTSLQNPRTQCEYDKSVVVKQFVLQFANNYTVLFYIAFVKGHLFTKPQSRLFYTVFERDACQPFSCLVPLCIQLVILLTLNNLATNLCYMLYLLLKKTFIVLKKRLRRQPVIVITNQPNFELEYELKATDRYWLTSHFCEMMIQYGYLTMFVAAFPLAPLIALVNSIIEHRFMAIKLVERCRRPLPRVVNGIGDWKRILLRMTYMSMATNAFVIAFTSDFIPRQLYKYEHHSLHGFVNSTLSKFAATENDAYVAISPYVTACYYRGKRLPPEHPNRYDLTEDYWYELTWKLICVFIFEHLLMASTCVMSFVVSSVPRSVRTIINIDAKRAKKAKLKILNDKDKGKGKDILASIHLEDHIPGPESDRELDGFVKV